MNEGRLSQWSTWKTGERIAAVSIVVTIILALPGILIAINQNRGKEPRLKLVALSLAEAQEIDALEETGRRTSEGRRVRSPAVDVTLQNVGDATGTVVRAKAIVHRAVRPSRCDEVGGGVQIHAQYDLKVPVPNSDDIMAKEVLGAPFPLAREMRFEIAPDQVQRLRLTIGPEIILEKSMPWIYQLDLRLIYDDERSLELGEMGILTNGGVDPTLGSDGEVLNGADLSSEHLACLRDYHSEVRQAIHDTKTSNQYLLQTDSLLNRIDRSLDRRTAHP